MNLETHFGTVACRERSGALSSSRFDYQKNWGLCELLRLHSSGKDYCIAFDYHDDIVIFDAEVNPTEIHFYQVKTKESGTWKLTDLLRRDTKKEGVLSYWGKLTENGDKFREYVASLNFLSNARYSVMLAGGNCGTTSTGRTQICANELVLEDRGKIAEQMVEELSLDYKPDFDDITHMKVCELSLIDHRTHTIGKVTEFLEEKFPSRSLPVTAFYRTLSDEIKIKNDYQPSDKSFSNIVKTKSITRKSFEHMIAAVGLQNDTTAMWNSLEHILTQEKYAFGRIQKIKRSWRRYELDRMNATNDVLSQLRTNIQHAINSELSNDSVTAKMVMEKAVNHCRKKHEDFTEFDDTYIEVVALMEFMEQHARELQEAHPQSQAETT